MCNKIHAFLDEVCSHVRCQAIHKEICARLTEHIESLKREYVEIGKDVINP